jgi:hypothetical protein
VHRKRGAIETHGLAAHEELRTQPEFESTTCAWDAVEDAIVGQPLDRAIHRLARPRTGRADEDSISDKLVGLNEHAPVVRHSNLCLSTTVRAEQPIEEPGGVIAKSVQFEDPSRNGDPKPRLDPVAELERDGDVTPVSVELALNQRLVKEPRFESSASSPARVGSSPELDLDRGLAKAFERSPKTLPLVWVEVASMIGITHPPALAAACFKNRRALRQESQRETFSVIRESVAPDR